MPGTNDNRTSISSLRPSHLRSAALAAAVVGVVVLPIAAAQATPSHNSAKQTSATGVPATGAPAVASAQLPQYCGSTQTGFQGKITAQPCIDDTAGAVTGVVYVGNATAQPVTVAINLTRADGTLAQMQCTIAAHDANGICSTGTVVAASGKGAFDAIAEAVPVGAPIADGVLHVESGQVTPADGSADGSGAAAASASSASPAA
ncbi:MAG TPA: hypothetical protein VH372_18045 [Actinospica sp.]|jgi:hypothetical protein|nr:hypothetical protein [Actinospica sp.]